MTFAAKRRLDYLLGEPLCALLNAWVRLLGIALRRNHALSPDFRRVWVLKFVGLGSLLNATPLLRALRKRYADAEFSLVCFPSNRVLGDRLGEIDRVLVVRDGKLSLLAWDCLRLLVRAWRERPELVVDLEVHSRFSTLLSVWTLARNRAGFYHSTALFRDGLYTHLMYFNRLQHIIDCHLQLGRALGCDEESPEASADLVAAADRDELRAFLAGHGIAEDSEVLVVNPNTGPLCEERRWPVEAFASLLNALHARGTWRFVLVGSPTERQRNQAVLSRLSPEARARTADAAGRLSFGGTLALLERAKLMISGDSGLLHFGAALGTKTVSVWGPTWPGAYAPRGQGHRLVAEPLYCAPCLHLVEEPPCAGDNLCLKRLPVRKVLAATLDLLGREASRTGDEPAEPPASGSTYLPGYLRRKSVPLSYTTRWGGVE